MRALFLCLGVATLTFLPIRAQAAPITFEGLTEGDVLDGTQFPGLTFSGGTVLTLESAGGSLNEYDFPPRSGSNVVGNEASLTISFQSQIQSFSAFFNYTSALSIEAFDAFGNPLGAVSSLFDNNGPFGGAYNPSELITLSVLAGISSITMSTADAGGVFTIDDLDFTAAPLTAPVPEPGTLLLVLTGIGAIARRVRASRVQPV